MTTRKRPYSTEFELLHDEIRELRTKLMLQEDKIAAAHRQIEKLLKELELARAKAVIDHQAEEARRQMNGAGNAR